MKSNRPNSSRSLNEATKSSTPFSPLCYWHGCTLRTYPTGLFSKQPVHLHIPWAVDCWDDCHSFVLLLLFSSKNFSLMWSFFEYYHSTFNRARGGYLKHTSEDRFVGFLIHHIWCFGFKNWWNQCNDSANLSRASSTQLQGLICPQTPVTSCLFCCSYSRWWRKRCHFCSVLKCSKNHWLVC